MLQAHADFVTSLLEILAVNQSRQIQSHAVTEFLLALARTQASLSRAYLQPTPKVVSFLDAVQPKFTAVSRSLLTFWCTEPPKTWPSLTLVCKVKSFAEYPIAKLFFVN